MESRTRVSYLEGTNLHTCRHNPLRINNRNPPLLGTPQNTQNNRINHSELLVAQVTKRCTKYIQGCRTCQTVKPDRQAKHAPLHPIDIPRRPWQIISMDMMGPLLESKGFNTILVVVDCFTKKSFFLPTHSTVTSKGITTLYQDQIFAEHGIPEKVISNWGSQFVSKFMKELFEVLRIKGNPSTAYHLQMDGQTKRVNQEVKEFLTMFINDRQDNWSDWLALAQFCHNDWEHSATKYSPFSLNYGYHPRKGIEPKKEYKVEAIKDFTERITNARDSATKALEQANKLMKEQYNKHKKPAMDYKEGDKVYINAEHLPRTWLSKKLDKKFFGPYGVLSRTSLGQSHSTSSWTMYLWISSTDQIFIFEFNYLWNQRTGGKGLEYINKGQTKFNTMDDVTIMEIPWSRDNAVKNFRTWLPTSKYKWNPNTKH